MHRCLCRSPSYRLLPVAFVAFVALLLMFSRSARGRYGESDSQPEVVIESGRIRGVSYSVPHLRASGDAYLGIPYAEPPVKRLRFRFPVPVKPWPDGGVLNATRLPNSCHQTPDLLFGTEFPGSNMWNPNTPVDEDCLYLNVWVPRTDRDKGEGGTVDKSAKLPVMVWIFGGGFYSGTTTLEVYDGRILASLHNTIVVSLGYRVGAFGFLCLDHPTAPCNVGMFDQRMALEWVRRNVRQFGGDADSVTLFGESAGSVSVSLHLLSPLSWDTFDRAILQSGTANMPWATVTMDEGKRRSVELAVDYMACRDTDDMGELADCLREAPAERILEQQWVSRNVLQFPFLPVVDNNFLKEPPAVSLRQGRFKKCPIVIGSNRNEGSWFIIYELYDNLTLHRKSMTRDEFVDSVGKLFYSFPQYPQVMNSSFAREAVVFRYTDWLSPDETDANLRGLDGAVGDFQFICPLNHFAQSYAAAGQAVYAYFFTQRYSSNPWPDWMGVLHGDEVLFTFGQPLKPGTNFTTDEKHLSRMMMSYWTTFAQTGDPNSKRRKVKQTALEWPIYTPQGMHYLELSTRYLDRMLHQSNAVGRGPRTNFCAFWYEYLPRLMSTTAGISERERDWKLQFSEWSTQYIVDWKTEFDDFVRRRTDKCDQR